MKRILLATAILLASVSSAGAAESSKREFRGAWLHLIGRNEFIGKSAEEAKTIIIKAFDALQEEGCNAVIFQVRPTADAFYKSQYEPWTKYLSGKQGVAPDPMWDPLTFVCEQAHLRGMELHAWLNPYRVTSGEKDELAASHLYNREPDRFLKYGDKIFFDPGQPRNIDWIVKIVTDIVHRYNVDAIHFDDYFYPYPVKGKEFPDDRSFEKYGKDFKSKADWRRDNCTKLIIRVGKAIKAEKPWVRFGISPFGIHRNKSEHPSGSDTKGMSTYHKLYADIPLWVQKGYIDYNVPQLYWEIGHPAADYDVLVHWWNDSNFGGHLYIGQDFTRVPEQIPQRLEIARSLSNVKGTVWWPGWRLTDGSSSIADSLRTNLQIHPALIPAYTAIDGIKPDAVSTIRAEGRKLQWTTEKTLDCYQQPAFYVIYRFPLGVEPDYNDSRYIWKITGSNFVFIPVSPWRFNYSVSVCDHCWNESAPSGLIPM